MTYRILTIAGGVTFTGSIVAFLKLAGRMSSRPTILPGRHVINSTLLGTNLATMGAFVSMAPGSPVIAATCLGANTALSFLKGYTTTAAIGGADMRMSLHSPNENLLTSDSCCHHRPKCVLGLCPSRGGFYAQQSTLDEHRVFDRRKRFYSVIHYGRYFEHSIFHS